MSLAIALFLTFFEKAYPLGATFGSVSTHLRSPVTTAMAFYTAGALMDFVGNASYLILRLKPDTATFLGAIREEIREVFNVFGIINLSGPTELLLLIAIFAAISIIYFLLVWPLTGRGPIGRAIAFPFRVTLYAAVISAAGLLFSMLVLLTESDLQWLGFEAPALLISAFYALIGVCALRHLFDLSRSQVVGIALLVAFTALFPTDSIFKSSLVASIGENTRFWARFLCSFTGDFIYVAALTGFAFRVAGSEVLNDRLVARWLMLLLILLVAGFALGNPTNTVAVAGVVLIASRWLLAPPDGQGQTTVSASGDAINWEVEEETFPFIVGGAAAFIFLIQFTFGAGGSDLNHRFPLLGLANVPRTFAIGAVAALVLARTGPSLRGDSATLKAAIVSVFILLTSLAASLATLQGRLIAVLAGNLGLVASLILWSVIVYDLQSARASDGHFEWRDLFKGTTLAQGFRIASAGAVALFSALSPIFIHEISDSIETLLKNELPQLQKAQTQNTQTQNISPQSPAGN